MLKKESEPDLKGVTALSIATGVITITCLWLKPDSAGLGLFLAVVACLSCWYALSSTGIDLVEYTVGAFILYFFLFLGTGTGLENKDSPLWKFLYKVTVLYPTAVLVIGFLITLIASIIPDKKVAT